MRFGKLVSNLFTILLPRIHRKEYDELNLQQPGVQRKLLGFHVVSKPSIYAKLLFQTHM